MKWTQISSNDLSSGDVVLVDWCKNDLGRDSLIQDFFNAGVGVSMPLHCGDPEYLARTLILGKITTIATSLEMWTKILDVSPALISRVKAYIINTNPHSRI